MRRLPSFAGLIVFATMLPGIARADTIRWDIVSLQPPNLAPGGEASARTEGDLRMTITGSGTFRVENPRFTTSAIGSVLTEAVPNPGDVWPETVRSPRLGDLETEAKASLGKATGGGNWTLRDSSGKTISTGTYEVIRLARFDPAPGTLPTTVTDQIGNSSDAHAGLAILEIEYSDATRGILVVSCHLVGTPDYIFEGIVISKTHGFFWNHEVAQGNPFVNANRTAFHTVK